MKSTDKHWKIKKNENLLKKIRSLSTNQSNDKKIIKNDNLQMHKSIID